MTSKYAEPALSAQKCLSAAQVARLAQVPRARVGGMTLAAIDGGETADLIVELVRGRERGRRPVVMSSANGEVISRCASSRAVAELFEEADLLSADGEPLVIASRWLCHTPLPERVATTDLFHDVARRAVKEGFTFYMLGADEEENRRATDRALAVHPGLRIVGRSHGYLDAAALERKVAEIDALAPDVLWVALGVPREQQFCRAYAARLGNVGLIKTSGGLFNFLSGTRSRAPAWMQRACLEWAWRLRQEPSRLFWRYATTNPHALYLLVSRSG